MVQHIYADVLLKIGDSKYLCISYMEEDQRVRLHDLGNVDKDGKHYRYVDMDVQQWTDFIVNAPRVLQDVPTRSTPMNIHIGDNIHIDVKPYSNYIHVRRFFLAPEDRAVSGRTHADVQLTPTRRGIVFTIPEWQMLLELLPLVDKILDDDVCQHGEECTDKHVRTGTNPNECAHCNPNFYQVWLDENKENQRTPSHDLGVWNAEEEVDEEVIVEEVSDIEMIEHCTILKEEEEEKEEENKKQESTIKSRRIIRQK